MLCKLNIKSQLETDSELICRQRIVINFLFTKMNFPSMSIAAFIFNIVTLIASCSSILIICAVFKHFTKKYKGMRNTRVMILYSSNTYIMLLGFSMIIIWHSLSTLLGDLGISTWDNTSLNWLCQLRGHLCISFVFAVYSSFSVQTIFRFFRVIYARFSWFLTSKCFFLIVTIQWLIAVLFPILFTQRCIYHPLDHSCYGSFDDITLFIYCGSIIYVLPMMIIGIIYWRLIQHTKRSPTCLNIFTARRDILVVRRILLLIGSLLILAVPAFTFWMMFLLTGQTYDLSFRISFMANSVTVIVLSIVTIFITPLKSISRVLKTNNIIILSMFSRQTRRFAS